MGETGDEKKGGRGKEDKRETEREEGLLGKKMTKVGERSRAAWSDCGLIWVHPCMHE